MSQSDSRAESILDPQTIEARLDQLGVDELARIVEQANLEYWTDNRPTLPDPLYDRIVERLRSLAADHPLLEDLGSRAPLGDVSDDLSLEPNQRLGAAVRHRIPMLSLEKCYDEKGLRDWIAKIDAEILVMPKIDGVACSIHYDPNGALVLAATRGSGTIGEDITANILEVTAIPRQITSAHPNGIEVRGEVYLPLSTFKTRFVELFSHPRNLAAGTLKQKERGRAGEVGLSFYAYDLTGGDFKNEREKLEQLRSFGFQCDHATVVAQSQASAQIAAFTALRSELDYEIDGIVFRCADTREYVALGMTGHHPKGAIAYKFQGESGTTRLLNVVWSVSRTGTITPVAQFEPVELSGAQLTRASLHNLTRFEELHLCEGATLRVTRRGGVIPMVEDVIARPDHAKPMNVPTRCPACHGPVERRRKQESDFLACVRFESCVSARLGELEHFAKVVDLQGFGPKVLAQAVEKGLLITLDSFYRLQSDDLTELERMGSKSAANLIAQIEAHRTLSLPTFLQALGIEHLGKQNSTLLAQRFGTLSAIRGLNREMLMEVPGIKEAIADAILAGLESRKETIDALLLEINVSEHEKTAAGLEPVSAFLSGKTFLFTGTLESMDRKSAEEKVKALGGSIVSGVSKKLNYLVSGESRDEKSSKMKKALELIEGGAKLSILDENEFLALLGDAR
jgi:DNA ligase (NAD+)